MSAVFPGESWPKTFSQLVTLKMEVGFYLNRFFFVRNLQSWLFYTSSILVLIPVVLYFFQGASLRPELPMWACPYCSYINDRKSCLYTHIEEDHEDLIKEEKHKLFSVARKMHSIAAQGVRVISENRLDPFWGILRNMDFSARERKSLKVWVKYLLARVSFTLIGNESEPPCGRFEKYRRELERLS